MFDISDEKYEEFRLILEKQNGQVYTLEDAKEISKGLIDFYDLLMRLDIENKEEKEDNENYEI